MFVWFSKSVKNLSFCHLCSLIFKSSFRTFLMKSNARNHKIIRFLAIWDLKSLKTASRGLFLNWVGWPTRWVEFSGQKDKGRRKKTMKKQHIVCWGIIVVHSHKTTCRFSLFWEKRNVVYIAYPCRFQGQDFSKKKKFKQFLENHKRIFWKFFHKFEFFYENLNFFTVFDIL